MDGVKVNRSRDAKVFQDLRMQYFRLYTWKLLLKSRKKVGFLCWNVFLSLSSIIFVHTRSYCNDLAHVIKKNVLKNIPSKSHRNYREILGKVPYTKTYSQ